MILLIAAPFVIAALLSMLSNKTLSVARYELKSAKLASNPVRIVMISDLHRRKLDPTNRRLVEKIAFEKPDLIVINGDMLEPDYTEAELSEYKSLLERLAEIAPVFFSAGNHDYPALFSTVERTETELLRGVERSGIVDGLEAAGAHFLERDYVDIEVNGELLRIGGLYAYASEFREYTEAQFESIREFLSDFQATERYTLMLAHRPESFTEGAAPSMWDIDLILSGHTHNGVVALPFGLGAIWSMSKFFPKYDRGLFDLEGSALIIGAGIDGYKGFIPRIFNPPEIVTVDILPEEVIGDQ